MMDLSRKFTDWKDIIEELDAGLVEVSKREADFLESLLETQPYRLTSAQVEWLQNMCERYGVSY